MHFHLHYMYSILYYSKHLYNAQINSELFKWVGWKKKCRLLLKIQEEFRVKKLAKAVTAIQFQLLFYCLLLFQCLCIAPTYELALQIGKNVEDMGKFMKDLQIIYAVRGERCKSQQSNLTVHQTSGVLFCTRTQYFCIAVDRGTKLNGHLIIGTPGTVCDWALKLRFFDLKKINVFVLDEADVMIATQGHQDQSIRIQRF